VFYFHGFLLPKYNNKKNTAGFDRNCRKFSYFIENAFAKTFSIFIYVFNYIKAVYRKIRQNKRATDYSIALVL